MRIHRVSSRIQVFVPVWSSGWAALAQLDPPGRACLGGDEETGWHRKAGPRHACQRSAFTTGTREGGKGIIQCQDQWTLGGGTSGSARGSGCGSGDWRCFENARIQGGSFVDLPALIACDSPGDFSASRHMQREAGEPDHGRGQQQPFEVGIQRKVGHAHECHRERTGKGDDP